MKFREYVESRDGLLLESQMDIDYGSFVLNFGKKYAGKPLKDIPRDYLEWARSEIRNDFVSRIISLYLNKDKKIERSADSKVFLVRVKKDMPVQKSTANTDDGVIKKGVLLTLRSVNNFDFLIIGQDLHRSRGTSFGGNTIPTREDLGDHEDRIFTRFDGLKLKIPNFYIPGTNKSADQKVDGYMVTLLRHMPSMKDSKRSFYITEAEAREYLETVKIPETGKQVSVDRDPLHDEDEILAIANKHDIGDHDNHTYKYELDEKGNRIKQDWSYNKKDNLYNAHVSVVPYKDPDFATKLKSLDDQLRLERRIALDIFGALFGYSNMQAMQAVDNHNAGVHPWHDDKKISLNNLSNWKVTENLFDIKMKSVNLNSELVKHIDDYISDEKIEKMKELAKYCRFIIENGGSKAAKRMGNVWRDALMNYTNQEKVKKKIEQDKKGK
jgi:hypothetical protein